GPHRPRTRDDDPVADHDGLDGCLFQLLLAANGCVRREVDESVAGGTNRICGAGAMNLVTVKIAAILPALMVSIFGIAVMVIEPFVSESKKSVLAWLALAGTIAAMFSLVPMAANRGQWYSNLWIVDDFDIFLSFVFLLIAAITILTSADYLR